MLSFIKDLSQTKYVLNSLPKYHKLSYNIRDILYYAQQCEKNENDFKMSDDRELPE